MRMYGGGEVAAIENKRWVNRLIAHLNTADAALLTVTEPAAEV